MKKLIAILLSLILVFAFSVSAFAASSPVAKEQVTVVLRKGDGISGALEADVKYTLDGGSEVSVVADEAEYGSFNSWSIYKVVGENKTVAAVTPDDYEIIKGGLKLRELTFLAHTDLIICGNYGNTVTDPLSSSSTSGTQTDESPETGDMLVLYAAIVMLISAATLAVAKKQFSK